MTDEKALLYGLAIFVGLLLAVLLRKLLSQALLIAARTVLGGGLLALLSPLGSILGLNLGVNLYNSLVIGVLGMPGLGLLMMLNWLVK